MTHRRHAYAASLLLALSLQGCGSPPAEPAAPAESGAVPSSAPSASAVATATPAASSPPAEESPRAKATKLIVRHVGSPEIDLHQRARIAAAGLSEEPVYGLGAWEKSLAAIVSPTIDPSQCEMILRATVTDPAIRAEAEKRCGPLEALRKRLEGLASDLAVKELTAGCKIDGVSPDAGLRPWAVLSAALIEDHLSKAPDTTPEERTIARALRHVCAGDGAKP